MSRGGKSGGGTGGGASGGGATGGGATGAARLYLAVALGSLVGGTLRWLASLALHGWLGPGFPWGTLFVNATGSFLIGLYAAAAVAAPPLQRQFVVAGVCGGYTTFSIFSLETLALIGAGQPERAALNVALSLALWLAAVWAGFALGQRLRRAPC